jgi:hypothetical protein
VDKDEIARKKKTNYSNIITQRYCRSEEEENRKTDGKENVNFI